MSIQVIKPQAGKVKFDLPYDEAEILLRAVGMINYGSMRNEAPSLPAVGDALVTEFGRNLDKEARKYFLEQSGWAVLHR